MYISNIRINLTEPEQNNAEDGSTSGDGGAIYRASNETPMDSESSVRPGRDGAEMAKLLFFRPGRQLLHGVITKDHRLRGRDLERELRKLGMEFNFSGRSQSGIVSIHVTDYASHLHWIHECHNYHGDCKCTQTRNIRLRGFSIKWRRIDKLNRWWERNLILYLQKQGRYPLQAFREGEDQMEEFLHAAIEANKTDGGRAENSLRCELDDIEDGRRDGESSDDDESMVSGSSKGTKRSWEVATRNSRGSKELAKLLWKLIERKLPTSTMALTSDPEYMELMEPLYYVDDVKRMKITNQCWENFLITWNRKSISEIITMRNTSTFNARKYFTPNYSLYIVMRLLKSQVKEPWVFIKEIMQILNMELEKRNTFCIWGERNCGKTWFINSLGDLLWNVGSIEANFNKTSTFPFEDLINKRMAILNEFNCSPAKKDTCKELFEGQPTSVNVKYQKPQKIHRTPIFITTNNNWLLNFDKVDSDAFRARCFFYRWQPQSWLEHETGYPHPILWSKLSLLSEKELWNEQWIKYESPPEREYNVIEHNSIVDTEALNDINKNLFN